MKEHTNENSIILHVYNDQNKVTSIEVNRARKRQKHYASSRMVAKITTLTAETRESTRRRVDVASELLRLRGTGKPEWSSHSVVSPCLRSFVDE